MHKDISVNLALSDISCFGGVEIQSFNTRYVSWEWSWWAEDNCMEIV